ncbi:DNA-3-methyladenine glycosylase family protein [Asanoa siamensis]|uniref:DNA-3-methyladenine glycosylase II n=1 Tax=Asanoa siamensis TaxID=926357 RepID=A0ABQ4D1T8_9ACTN|nr:DNA-3-methyladenine glycosylase 2 family protein [Asanoa siamensis]GIF77502.1 DNA-3-methyladenine glycosidase [Asanoa siamensis]
MVTFRQAAQQLAEREPVMARLVRDGPAPRIPLWKETNFESLVRGIIFQQLARPAAVAILGRLVDAVDGEITPDTVLPLSDTTLRAVGLSARKVISLRDLATKVRDGTVVLDNRRLGHLADDEIIRRLSTVKGIGPWSAQLFLIFQLRRQDVWPVGDLGIRRGYGVAYGIPTPTEKELEPLGERFRPYRSTAAWYCWMAEAVLAGRTATLPIADDPILRAHGRRA